LYGKVKARSTPLSTWREGKLKQNQTFDVKLGKLYEGQHLGATLTWFRHVGYKDKNGNGLDGKDTFYQTASLADFTLTLLRDGVPIGGSDSSVDNLEHLSWTLEATANYTLRIYRFEGSGLTTEQFALAAQVMKGASAAAVQRELLASSDRGAAYAAAGLSRGLDVPEPAGVLWVVMGMAMMVRRRRQPQAQ
jgi:hypothetical protein